MFSFSSQYQITFLKNTIQHENMREESELKLRTQEGLEREVGGVECKK